MASFAYSAINASGLELKGEIHAPDMTAAREALRVRGMLALDLKQQAASSDGIAAVVKKVKPKALQIFSRQFATMIEAGLNVVTALVILEDQTEDKKLASVITEVRADVEGGLLLSEAIARHPRIFSRLYISMVEAGEAAGILDVVLDRVAIQIEKETKIKRRVKGAMMYPLMVLAFASVVMIGMLLFLVPIFVGIFAQLGGDLPTLTQWVLKASNIVRYQWYILFPGIFGVDLRVHALQEDGEGTALVGPHADEGARGDRQDDPEDRHGAFLTDALDARRLGCRHHPRPRDHRHDLRQQHHRGRRRRSA